MRLDLNKARIINVNLDMEPGFVWLTVMLPRRPPGDIGPELRGVRLSPEQLKELLNHGDVTLP